MKSKYIEVDEFKIHYLEGGKGKSLVLLPSLGITSKSYQHLGERLAEEYRVIIPDLGKGKSSGQKLITSLYEHASLLNRFLKQLKINKFHLLGFSFGGLIAGEYYKKHPLKTKSLLLVSTTLIPIKGKLLLKGFPQLFFKNLFTREGRKLDLLWLSDGFVSFSNQPRQVLKNFHLGFKNLASEITELKIPNLLILADKDEFISSETIRKMKNIKGVNLKIIRGNHDWFFLEPEKFLIVVKKFLRENC